MLEQMRQKTQSWIIWLFFGIIIAVFIVNFGPQSPSSCDPAPGTGSYAAKVAGHELTPNNFLYGFMMAGGAQRPAQLARQMRLKETVMDKLIERELLAAEAQRLGFHVGDNEVEDFISDSKVMSLGYEQPLTVAQKDGKFDYDLFKRFVQFQLRMTPKTFIDEQRRELLAHRMRHVLRGGVNVSTEEVKEDFIRRGNQVNLEYVRYVARRYEDQIEVTAAEVDAHAKANEAKLKSLYDQRKFLYEKAPKERRLRQIIVKLDSGAKPEVEAAAKKKADDLVAKLKKGEAFATLAKAGSDDARTKARGGDLGWRRQGGTTLPEAVEKKVWEAKDGEVIGPEKTDTGFFIVAAEGAREGDIPFDKVKLELAEEHLRQEKGKAKAKQEADAALAKAKAAKDKSLKDLFPAAPDAVAIENAPRAEETGLFSRRGNLIEGIGPSPEMAKAVFDLKTEEPFAGPFEVGGGFVVVKLKEKKQADMAEFEKKKGELVADAAAVRGEEVLESWAQRRCVEARDAKKIEVNRELLRYEDSEAPTPYEPCSPPQMRF